MENHQDPHYANTNGAAPTNSGKKRVKVSHPEDPEKKKIHRSKSACTACHRARARCDSQRPCGRCTRLGIADRCETFIGKKRGRKPVLERNSSPTSPSEEQSQHEEHEHEHEHDHDHDHPECLSNASSPCSSNPNSLDSYSSALTLSSSASLSSLSYDNQPPSAEEDLQKYLAYEPHQQQQLQLLNRLEDEDLDSEPDQTIGLSSNDNICDDALVPSLIPPQYKEFVVPTRPLPPAIYLGVDESRASKVFIRSTTRSFSDLLQFPHGQLEGMDFRDLMPRTMFRSCLLSCYQKLIENQEFKQQLLVFKVPTILKGRSSQIPVELTFNVSGEITETAVNRVDVRELSMQEALSLGLPIFNHDLDDSGIMNSLSFDDYLSFGVDQTC